MVIPVNFPSDVENSKEPFIATTSLEVILPFDRAKVTPSFVTPEDVNSLLLITTTVSAHIIPMLAVRARRNVNNFFLIHLDFLLNNMVSLIISKLGAKL